MLIAFIIIVLLDQLLKYISSAGGLLISNYNLIFGLFPVSSNVSILISLVLLALALREYINIRNDEQVAGMVQWALVLFMSGGISNLIDKVVYGFVRDYINIRIVPVFNLADSVITVAVILYGYACFKYSGHFRRQ